MKTAPIIPMSNRGIINLSIGLSVFLLFFSGIFFFVMQMIALNGVMDNRATVAMGIYLGSQLLIIVGGGFLASWASKFLIEKYHWNKIPVLAVVVLAISLMGVIFSFLLVILSALFAGIR